MARREINILFRPRGFFGYCQPAFAAEKTVSLWPFLLFSFSHSGQTILLMPPQPTDISLTTNSQPCLSHFSIFSSSKKINFGENKKASHLLSIAKLCLRDGKPCFTCCHPYSENKKTLASVCFRSSTPLY